ncbi:MAG: hypothetical protein ACLFTT_08135 [Candidatus Hydrogenedentota bacterium]
MQARLGDIAHARSGDMGSGADIGVLANAPAAYAWLAAHRTAEKVAAFLHP